MDHPAMRRIQCLFDSYGDTDYIGEPVSIVNHCLQAAYQASSNNFDDNELVLAALCHDIGHVLGLEANLEFRMGGCGIMHHECIGAEFARQLGFSERVAKLILSHVAAKRYLCFQNPDYLNKLTSASKTTLEYQGGQMSKEEAEYFQLDPDFENYLIMRSFDELAKDPHAEVPPLSSYSQRIQQLIPNPITTSYLISKPQLCFFNTHGYLKITNLLAFEELSILDIEKWIHEVIKQNESGSGSIIQSEENEKGEKILCRCENFVDQHEKFGVLAKEKILRITDQLFGRPSTLLKEKINFKLPGGAGFAAHQDTPAYVGLGSEHITCMIAIDDANELNGGLQLAAGVWNQTSHVPLSEVGIVTTDYEKSLQFELIACKAGDVLFFSGYIPHRSSSNRSEVSRRALFLTYNPLEDGDFHQHYYHLKNQGSLGFNASTTLSFQGDFQGKIVSN